MKIIKREKEEGVGVGRNPFHSTALFSFRRLLGQIANMDEHTKTCFIVYLLCIVSGLEVEYLTDMVDSMKFSNPEMEEMFLDGLETYLSFSNSDPENN